MENFDCIMIQVKSKKKSGIGKKDLELMSQTVIFSKTRRTIKTQTKQNESRRRPDMRGALTKEETNGSHTHETRPASLIIELRTETTPKSSQEADLWSPAARSGGFLGRGHLGTFLQHRNVLYLDRSCGCTHVQMCQNRWAVPLRGGAHFIA